MPTKKVIVVVLAIVIIVSGIFIVSYKFLSRSLQPPNLILSEEEWDFGIVKPNEKPTHIFTLKNEGDEELIIEKVWASCACVETSISNTNIRPGKYAELKAIFDTTGYEGKVKKDVYVRSNDPMEPEKRIPLNIEIEHQSKPVIIISKTEWNMGLVSQGDILNLTFTIENQGDAELIIDKIETYEHIQYNSTLPLKISPKEKFELILIYDSTNHKLGDVREAVRIYCNDPTTESFAIRISGYIKEKETPEISIFPTGAILDLAPDSEEGAIGKFILKNSGAETVKIISLKSSVGYLAPLKSEFSLNSRKEQDLQVVLLKDKAREEIKENKTEEYLYLTIAIPIKINK